MAKNKVEIDVKVDDKGTTKKLGLESQAAAKGIDGLGKGARTADRNIKGVAQASSNGTKNFSKMSQGMGGLVAVYATFAAQMFAVTAAFGFLKRAGDLEVLRQGQITYAASTGIAMQSLTRDIQAATGAQIAFRDASQAAAIGVASGLSPDQLTKLGKAAKDASAVLGRDVTDSFNRLVRGVTKAEPELLDELGIILRLKDASEKYAIAIGKDVNALSAFERSQAVANDVLAQSEDKYGRMLAIVGGGTENEFNKLAVQFDNIVMKIQQFVLPAANALAKVLIDTPMLAGASFALLSAGPLRALGFNLKGASDAMLATSASMIAQQNASKIAIDSANTSIQAQIVLLQQASAAAMAQGGQSKLMQHLAGGGKLSKAGMTNLKKSLDRANVQITKSGKVTSGIFKGLSAEIVLTMSQAFAQIELDEKEKVVQTEANTSKMRQAYLKVGAAASKAGGAVTKWGGKILGALGWIGIIYTVGSTIVQMFKDQGDEAENSAPKIDVFREKIKDLNAEYEKFIQLQGLALEGREMTTSGFATAAGSVGNFLASSKGFDKQVLSDRFDAAGLDKENKAIEKRNSLRLEAHEISMPILMNPGEQDIAFRELNRYSDSLEPVKELTEAQTEALKRHNMEMSALNDIVAKAGGNSGLMNAYTTAIREGMDPEKILKARAALIAHLQEMGTLPKVAADAATGMKSFLLALAPESTGDSQIKQLQEEARLIEKAKKDRGFFLGVGTDASETARIKEISDQVDFIQRVEAAGHKAKLDALGVQQESLRLDQMRNPVAQDLAKAALDHGTHLIDITNKQASIALLEETIKNTKGGITAAQQRQLDLEKGQLLILEAKANLSDQELQDKAELYDIELDLYNLKTDTKLLNFEKQSLDFLGKKLKVQRDLLKQREKSEQRTVNNAKRDFANSSSFSGMFQEKFDAAADLKLAESLRYAQEDQVRKEGALKTQMINMEYDLLDAKLLQTQLELKRIALDQSLTAEQRTQAGLLAGKIGTQRAQIGTEGVGGAESTGLRGRAERANEQGTAGKLADIGDNVDKLKEAKTNLSDIKVLSDGIANSFATNMQGAFASIIDGTKSASAAFGDMAKSMLGNIANILAEMLTIRLIKGMFGPDFQFSGGGIADNGKKVPMYANGGVASGSTQGHLAMLHGTEAVVPLPNGKSIPVEMQGSGSSQVNQITVNVSNDGQTSTEGGKGMDMEALGTAVASAVQKELQNQKRSGGILNPYGVA